MSSWGFWGYAGLMAGVVMLVAMTLVCLSWLTVAPVAQPEEREGEATGDRPEQAARGTRHAA